MVFLLKEFRRPFQDSPSFSKQERGAALVEAALVIATFFFTLLVFIDICRYFAARTLMLKAVDDAASLAAVASNFDLDTVAIKDPTPSGTTTYTDFVAARERIFTEATALPEATFIGTPASTSAIKFEEYVILDELYPTGGGAFSYTSPPTPVVSALVLRPGESARRRDASGVETWVHHPVRCSPQAVADGCTNPRFTYERMSGMLETMPIYVELSANFQSFNPFFGTFPIRVSGMAWRDQPAKSGFREGAQAPTSGPVPITYPGGGTTVCPAPESPSSCSGGTTCYNGCVCVSCGGA